MAPSGRRHWTRLTNGPPPRPDCSSPAAGTSKAVFLVTRSGRSVVVTADAFPLLRHCEELGQRFQLPTPREPPVAAGHIVVIGPVGRERFGRSVPSSRMGRWPPPSYPSWHVVLFSTVAAVAVGADAADCSESLAPLSIGFRSGSQVHEGSPSSRCGFSDGYKLRPDGIVDGGGWRGDGSTIRGCRRHLAATMQAPPPGTSSTKVPARTG